jgi:hypothetical protein
LAARENSLAAPSPFAPKPDEDEPAASPVEDEPVSRPFEPKRKRKGDVPADNPFAPKDEAPADNPFASAASTAAPVESPYDDDNDDEVGPFTGSSPFVGSSAGDARVDETRIDTGLRVDTKLADELASKSAGGPADADEEPADSTKIDEFRLSDLDDEETRLQAVPDASAETSDEEKPADDEKTDEKVSGSRSPKDKM